MNAKTMNARKSKTVPNQMKIKTSHESNRYLK